MSRPFAIEASPSRATTGNRAISTCQSCSLSFHATPGKTCKALPSAVEFLVIFAFLNILCLPIELYNNWKRINKDLDPKMDCHVIPEEGELYEGHKTLANVYMVCRGASRATRLTG